MLNNKGQSIVIFVLALPIILLFISYVYDIVNVNYYRNKLDGISKIIKDNNGEDACLTAKKNDKDIICNTYSDKVILIKKIKTVFGKIARKDYYELKVTINIEDV